MYLLYIDLSAAFNTVDHPTLGQILEILGLPEDMRGVIATLYRGVTTRIKTPFGLTEPIPVKRGTLQGDSLSPTLFLLYIEPLLRWLHQGGHGYHYGCLSPQENAQHHLSSGAFADDLLIPTNSPSLLHHQAKKVTLFCNWAGLTVNAKKCAVTAALFHIWYAEGTHNYKHIHNDNRPQAKVASLQIQNQPIPFLPHTQPYTYLGIPLTLTLDWTPALQSLIQKIQYKGKHLLQAQYLTASERHRILEETIIPMADYMLTLSLFTPAQIDLIQGQMARIVKLSHGLPQYFPIYSVFNTHKEGGLGSGSLFHRGIKNATRDLTNTLNDQGRLGTVSRALGQAQYAHWKNHPKIGTPTLGPFGHSSIILRLINAFNRNRCFLYFTLKCQIAL
jgi:hypothetical protein